MRGLDSEGSNQKIVVALLGKFSNDFVQHTHKKIAHASIIVILLNLELECDSPVIWWHRRSARSRESSMALAPLGATLSIDSPPMDPLSQSTQPNETGWFIFTDDFVCNGTHEDAFFLFARDFVQISKLCARF